MRYKKIITLLVVTMLALNLVACATSNPEDTTQSSVFQGTQGNEMVTLNVTSEPTELNPMRMSDTIDQSILYHCMSGFTKLNEKDEPVADLAERWDINETNTTYTMHLRKDAKWSNGDPVTVNDFYYSWVTQMKPSTGSIYAIYLYKNIKNGEAFYKGEVDESQLGLKILDDYTLEIQWSHPMTNGLFYLSQPYFLPINQKAYEAIGDEQYAKEADKMVTNGAYKITEWVHDDHITMEKFKNHYNASEINIPKVKLVMIGDANTSLNAFTAGEVDLCNLYNEQIKLVEEKSKDVIQSYIDGGSWYLSFNTQDEYLSNINLRKALAYSIDIQSLLDNVINDGSIVANGLVPGVVQGADGKGYAESRGSIFKYDKDKAKEYLNKALKELGIEKKDIKLVFWTSDTTYNQNQAAYLQQQWKENLGLDVELKSTAAKALSEAMRNGDYSFGIDAWGPSENDAITFLENYTTENMNNHGKYSNQKYDKLIEDSAHESDPKKRQEILIQAEKILMDDMVIGPMYFTCTTYAVSDKLVGLVRTPFQFFNVLNAHIK